MSLISRMMLLGIFALILVVPVMPTCAQVQFPGDSGPDGLVPCGDTNESRCELCHLNALAQDVLKFVVYVAVFIATIMISYAGFKYITAMGDTGKISEAHGIFRKVVIGLIFILAAWLIVDTLMKFFYNGSGGSVGYGVWNDFGSCVNQSAARPSQRQAERGSDTVVVGDRTQTDGSTPSPSSYTLGSGTYSAIAIESARRNTEQWNVMIEAAAAREGVPAERLRAMMMVESAGDPKVIGRNGEVGLLQVKPETARSLDPSLRTYSASELAVKLKDPQYNIDLGAKYYGSLYRSYGGDADRATAAYNGGPKANERSTVCAGQLAWQCGQNSGYQVTRNYINNVNQIELTMNR